MANEFARDWLQVLNTCLVASEPRVIAILPVAYLETHLTEVIQKRLPGLTSRLRGRLFLGNGILTTIAAKIDMAQALGAISPELASEALKLAEIRNLFAHRLDIKDFEHPEVLAVIAKLPLVPQRMMKVRTEEGLQPVLKDNADGEVLARRVFNLFSHLQSAHRAGV